MSTTVLIVAEHLQGKLNPSTAKCVSCAQAIAGAEIDIVVLAVDAAAVAKEAAALAGVRRVLTLERPENAEPLAAVWAPQIAELARNYSHVFGPSTTFGKDLLPRVAALLGVGQISDVMAVESAQRFRRPVYAANAVITVEAPAGNIVVATVRTASYQPAAGGGTASIERAQVNATLPTHTRFVSRSAANADRPDLQTAARVVSGGRALASAENFKLLYRLADALGAAVGASRAAVDAGYAANDLQVGQTGKIIAPELYVALGISGAIQHLTGIKDARTIVAVNKDSEAPIFEVADIGLVGDLFQIVPELERLIRARGG
jgi:electron transfer flavoprotein alpha subunit